LSFPKIDLIRTLPAGTFSCRCFPLILQVALSRPLYQMYQRYSYCSPFACHPLCVHDCLATVLQNHLFDLGYHLPYQLCACLFGASVVALPRLIDSFLKGSIVQTFHLPGCRCSAWVNHPVNGSTTSPKGLRQKAIRFIQHSEIDHFAFSLDRLFSEHWYVSP